MIAVGRVAKCFHKWHVAIASNVDVVRLVVRQGHGNRFGFGCRRAFGCDIVETFLPVNPYPISSPVIDKRKLVLAILGTFFQKGFTIQVKIVPKSVFVKIGVCRRLVKLGFFAFRDEITIFPKDERPGFPLVYFVFLDVVYPDIQFQKIWVDHRKGVPDEITRNVAPPRDRFIKVVEQKHFIALIQIAVMRTRAIIY